MDNTTLIKANRLKEGIADHEKLVVELKRNIELFKKRSVFKTTFEFHGTNERMEFNISKELVLKEMEEFLYVKNNLLKKLKLEFEKL